jgi:hypothetical protein
MARERDDPAIGVSLPWRAWKYRHDPSDAVLRGQCRGCLNRCGHHTRRGLHIERTGLTGFTGFTGLIWLIWLIERQQAAGGAAGATGELRCGGHLLHAAADRGRGRRSAAPAARNRRPWRDRGAARLAETQLNRPQVTDLRRDVAAFDQMFDLPAPGMKVVSTFAGPADPWQARAGTL